MKVQKYIITKEDTEKIKAYRTNKISPYLNKKLYAVQLVGEGKTTKEICSELNILRDEIYRWVKNYCTKGGVAGLLKSPGQHGVIVQQNNTTGCYNTENIYKEVHFWLNNEYPKRSTIHLYNEAAIAIQGEERCVHTTQIALCTTEVLKSRRIFIHPYIGKPFEISLYMTNHNGRQIRPAHNLFKLLISGDFDWNSGDSMMNVVG